MERNIPIYIEVSYHNPLQGEKNVLPLYENAVCKIFFHRIVVSAM